MKIYLQNKATGSWEIHEGTLDELSSELSARNISIGEWASIGECASIGEYASIGEWASIGEYASIGESASIGECASIGEYASIGESASIGECASIGEWAIIGESARIESKYGCIILSPLGSRQAPMTAYPQRDTIYIGTGCFLGSIESFEAAVRKTHAGTQHETEYLLALKYVREKFAKK
jgi:UDP-3-O-[3-hydroxymyristoyl] glucosamine N-acyltransferase